MGVKRRGTEKEGKICRGENKGNGECGGKQTIASQLACGISDLPVPMQNVFIPHTARFNLRTGPLSDISHFFQGWAEQN